MSTASLSLAAGGQSLRPQVAARPEVRISGHVDPAVTVALPGTHPAVTQNAVVGDELPAATALTHLHLVLSPTEAQASGLRSLLDQQQDKSSANYHKWLSPELFGQYFGAAPADVNSITAWLGDAGFTIESVSKSNRIINFAGTVGQVEQTFHTQMRRVTVDGESHISNTTDIAVPSALAGVVKGIASLNDFRPRSNAVKAGVAQLGLNIPANNYVTDTSSPQFGSSSTGTHFVSPGDAATIFNTQPLLSNGINGTGVTISVLARSNITLSDVQAFRTLFGLPNNDPHFIVVGSDPGQNGDDTEAYLDAEWAGAMAPAATVNFIVGGPSLVSGGIDSAGIYAVDNNIGDIITLSYGGCERRNGPVYTGFYNLLWEQAAAQGQSVFVSTGDSGAAGCDSSSATYATGGYGVNALGSSASNVAVGGTMFVDYGPAQYWANGINSIPYATALSYIPEAAWNQGRLSTTYLNSASTAAVTGSGIVGTGGGIAVYTARPSWQTGSNIALADPVPATGNGRSTVPSDPGFTYHRLVPDISLIAASGHDGSLFCGEGICGVGNNGLTNAGIVGGTSVSTPVMASMQALINQKNGGRQGNPNYFYYPLAAAQYSASSTACQAPIGTAANPTVTLPAASCNFHDIVAGDNIVPTASTGTAGIGFSALPGFDEATGLGTLNAFNLASNWSTVSFRSTTTSFTLSPTSGIAHGTNQQIAITVSASSGTPTGDVSLIAETTNPYTANQFTLTGGSFSGTVQYLPAGSYNVHVHYAGDGTFAPSDSASIPVVIGKEGSNLTLGSYLVTPTGSITTASSYSYGDIVYVDAQVLGNSGSGQSGSTTLPIGTVPSGTITFTISRNGVALPSLTVNLDTYGDAFFEAVGSYANYYLKANYGALTPGAYTLNAAYSGDRSFNSSSSSLSFTVGLLAPTVSFAGSTNITPGATATYTYSIAMPTSLTAAATGNVAFTDTTTNTVLGTASLTNGATTFSTTALTSTGPHVISAVYTGDGNYAAKTSTVTTTVGPLASETVSVSVSGTPAVNYLDSLVATLSQATTGVVQFFDNGSLVGSVTLTSASTTATFAYNGFTAGTHTVAANFLGNASYAAATGSTSTSISMYPTSMTASMPLTTVYGQPFAVQAELRFAAGYTSAAIAPTGTISVLDGGSVIASTSTFVFESGYLRYGANLIITNLSPGSHTISVTYSGDSNFTPAGAATNTVTAVKLTPTITLTTSATSFNGSNSVPLTAFIPLAANLSAPVSISFYDGSVLLGSATATYNSSLGGYVATFTATNLSAGPHSFTAVLTSDGYYNAATSAPLVVNLNANNVWIANGNNSVSGLSGSGSAITPTAAQGGGVAIAIDSGGYVWSLNQNANSVSKYTNAGTTVSAGLSGGGISTPTALAIDGAGVVWITNGTGTLSALSSAGSALSPGAGYSAPLASPSSINVDASGNLWITNAGDSSVTEVIGAAAPVLTPTATAVKNNAVASKP